MGRRLGYALVVVIVLLAATSGWAKATPTPAPESTHAASPGPEVAPTASGPETVMQQLDALRLEVNELRATLHDPSKAPVPPAWAAQMQEQLDQRLERMAEMQERLAARIETPAPRLDEPIVLFTVAGCTLLLGFVVGRGVQRRNNRRDLRLRL